MSDADLEAALRFQLQRYAERAQQELREQREVSGLVRDVFKDAWTSFYAHELPRSAQLLRSLEVASPQRPPALDTLDEHSPRADATDMAYSSSSSGVTLNLWSRESPQASVLFVSHSLELPTGITSYAYPKYESCTPSLENIRYDGDPRILRFIPYADEAGFQELVEPFARPHALFAWQAGFYDVDFKLIAADAYLRLDAAGMDPKRVERHKPRFLPSRGADGRGAISSLKTRDLHGWGSDALESFHTVKPPPSSLMSQVNSMLAVFCSSLDCIKAKCMLHDVIAPPITLELPTRENKIVHDEAKMPCKNNCFLQYTYEEFLEMPLAVEEEICDILRLYPDRRPCTLAQLARSTCYNIFHHRCFLFPDGGALYENVVDYSHLDSTFCTHTGPCSRQIECVCVLAKRPCQRRCRCSQTTPCPKRFKGCTQCNKNKCLEWDCVCRMAADGSSLTAECDPELCKKWRQQGNVSIYSWTTLVGQVLGVGITPPVTVTSICYM